MKRVLHIIAGIGAAIGLGLIALPVCAQTAIPAEVREGFSEQAPVSGALVAGVTLGAAAGTADPSRIELPLRNVKSGTRVCLSSRTRDGQYWGLAQLTVPQEAPRRAGLSPRPAWRFLPQLSRYPSTDFAAMARVGPDCDIDPSAAYLPVSLGADWTTLTLSLNDQRAIRLDAYIEFQGQSLKGQCTPAGDGVRAVAFNMVCRFDLSRVSAGVPEVTVLLDRKLRTGPRQDRIRIVMP
ncbi:MAG: hypothetical protein QM667_07785 [Asticcacaulis sp.]